VEDVRTSEAVSSMWAPGDVSVPPSSKPGTNSPYSAQYDCVSSEPEQLTLVPYTEQMR